MGKMKLGSGVVNQAYVEPEVIERIVEVPVQIEKVITKEIIKEVPVASKQEINLNKTMNELFDINKNLSDLVDSEIERLDEKIDQTYEEVLSNQKEIKSLQDSNNTILDAVGDISLENSANDSKISDIYVQMSKLDNKLKETEKQISVKQKQMYGVIIASCILALIGWIL